MSRLWLLSDSCKRNRSPWGCAVAGRPIQNFWCRKKNDVFVNFTKKNLICSASLYFMKYFAIRLLTVFPRIRAYKIASACRGGRDFEEIRYLTFLQCLLKHKLSFGHFNTSGFYYVDFLSRTTALTLYFDCITIALFINFY